MTNGSRKKGQMPTRREALRRLGLCVGIAYSAPSVLTVSQARAASGSGSGGSGGGSSEASAPSTPSAPSAPSSPTPPSAPSSPSASPPDGSTGSSGSDGFSTSGSTRRNNTCKSLARDSDGPATIPRSDYREAQRAVERGEALPLGTVSRRVKEKIGGRLIEVRFHRSGSATQYEMRMISREGSLVSVHVNARTAQIISVQGC